MAGPEKRRALAQSPTTIEHTATDLVLAKRGDVLLQLSKNGTAAGTLLVSSLVLGLASPVFEAMFNGNFTEGHGLSPVPPKKIALPDDDAMSMSLICKLIHMQTEDLVDEPSFSQLADIVIVCDKYRCTESVRSWLQLWIKTKVASPEA